MRLGIDFGTCYSSAALLLDGTPRPIKEPLKQSYSFPSSVYLTEREEILVGQAAENKRQKNPQRYRREFKRDLGSSDPYTLGDSFMLPEELVTEVLKKLKQEAEKVAIERGEKNLNEVLITVPATYQAYKRKLMEEACSQAGFSNIELLSEPVAAAIYYSGHATVESGDTILVYDLGGGTFDATLIQKKDSGYELLGMPKGLSNCGGIEFDRQIYQELKSNCSEELRQQLNAKDAWLARAIVSDLCRDLKHQLSEEQEATIYIPMGLGKVESFSLSRTAFNQIIAPLIDETIDCCDQLVRNTGIDWSQISQVLLIGGSCRIPYVKEVIARKLGRSPLLVDEPELAVCLGAILYRNIQEEVQRKEEIEQYESNEKETESNCLSLESEETKQEQKSVSLKLIHKFEVDGLVRHIAVSQSGKKLVACCYDNSHIFLFDVSSGQEKLVSRFSNCCKGRSSTVKVFFVDFISEYTVISFSTDGDFINVLQLWQIDESTNQIKMQQQSSSNGKLLFSCNSNSLALNPRKKILAMGKSTNKIALYNLNLDLELPLINHNSMRWFDFCCGVTCCAFSPDGKYLASGSGDKTVRIWELSTGKCIFNKNHYDGLRSVAFSPNSQLLAYGGLGCSICISQIKSKIKTLDFLVYNALSICFSPDCKILVGTDSMNDINLWQLDTGKRISILNGGEGICKSNLVFSPDGRFLASGGYNTIKIWQTI